jgi:hypothetical protein
LEGNRWKEKFKAGREGVGRKPSRKVMEVESKLCGLV